MKGKHGSSWLPWYCFSTGVQANLQPVPEALSEQRVAMEVLSPRHLLRKAALGVLEPSHQAFPLQAQAVVLLGHLSKGREKAASYLD